MIQDFEEAQLTIQRHVAKEIDWFIPSSERHFDPVSVIFTFAGILMTAFLAGFVDEAKGAAKKAGVHVYHRLEELVKDLLTNKNSIKMGDLDDLAEQAPAIAQEIGKEQALSYMATVEVEIRTYFETNLPPDRAASLAKTMREALEPPLLKGLQ